MTGEILTQFVEGIEVTQEMRDSIQPDTLNSYWLIIDKKALEVNLRLNFYVPLSKNLCTKLIRGITHILLERSKLC